MNAKLDQILKNQLTLLSAIDHRNEVHPDVSTEIYETEKLLNPLIEVSKGTQCQKCGEFGQDRRTLHMSCLYEMDELRIPFIKKPRDKDLPPEYILVVCKDCRSSWMEAIEDWFND